MDLTRAGGVEVGWQLAARLRRGTWSTLMRHTSVVTVIAIAIVTAAPLCGALANAATGRVSLSVIDKATGQPVPCRVHLADASGKPVQPPALPFWRDHFVCDGKVALDLAAGRYTYTIERGPEYRRATGAIDVAADKQQAVRVTLARMIDLAAQGWWSGELHVHRPVEQIELHMRAEDLHVAPVITWWNDRNLWQGRQPPADPLVRFDGNRWYHVMAGEDEREGGALMYFNLDKPMAITGASREYPSPMTFLLKARKHAGVWVDVEKPFWWDAPVWLASGKVDSIGLANNHMCRSRMYEDEAWGRPRDEKRLPPPRGNGFWTQEIYYHILNCGLRVPPSAGSASGVLPNPVGYNRVYVHVDGDVTYDKWWQGLRAGHSFVTNGPLLLCTANGQTPGHVFKLDAGQTLTVALDCSLTTQDPVHEIQIIANGQVAATVPFTGQAKITLPAALKFERSGWFLVRAIADVDHTFRFASTAPWHVEVGDQRRVSKASAQFFIDWVNQRRARVKIDDAAKRAEVLKFQNDALAYWQNLLDHANAP